MLTLEYIVCNHTQPQMANSITAQKKVGDKTVTRSFNKITWDLLTADKSGWEQTKAAKEPEEVKTKKEK